MLPIFSVKMGWVVIVEIHFDDDTKETTDSRYDAVVLRFATLQRPFS